MLLSFDTLVWSLMIWNDPLRKHVKPFGMLCKIEWKRILSDLGKAPDVVYQDILNEFDSTWGVKGLIVTQSNPVITWKVRPQMGISSWFPLSLRWSSPSGCSLVPFIQLIFQNLQRKARTYSCEINAMLRDHLWTYVVLVWINNRPWTIFLQVLHGFAKSML